MILNSPAGQPGPAGAAGATGATGAAGNSVRNGSGAPSAGLGSNGDFYIDILNHKIYGPKTAGSWGSATDLGNVSSSGTPSTGDFALWTNTNQIGAGAPHFNSSDSSVSGINSFSIGGITHLDIINNCLVNSAINRVTLDWGIFSQYDYYGYVSIDWNNRVLEDSSEAQSLSWYMRQQYDSGGAISIDWNSRQLITGSGAFTSYDWANGQANNPFNGITVLSTAEGTLSDPSTGSTIIDFVNCVLNGGGGLSLDFANRLAKDNLGNTMIDYQNGAFYAPGGGGMAFAFDVTGNSYFYHNIYMQAHDVVLDTTTGTKIGTATNQKLGFFNSTPIVQPNATTDLGTVLSNLGLRNSGTAYPITTSGNVSMTGGMTYAYLAKTGTYSILTTDYFIDCTSGTFTLTLPTAVGVKGQTYIMKNSGTGAITIATTSSQTIDGFASAAFILRNTNQYVQIISDNANWKIIGGDVST